jgi:hypothetical protein
MLLIQEPRSPDAELNAQPVEHFVESGGAHAVILGDNRNLNGFGAAQDDVVVANLWRCFL